MSIGDGEWYGRPGEFDEEEGLPTRNESTWRWSALLENSQKASLLRGSAVTADTTFYRFEECRNVEGFGEDGLGVVVNHF